MARNGSGTYAKVNTFVSGTTITAVKHNENWDDLATELTNSVAADGQTTMTGPLKAANGTAAAPSYAFGSDSDTGLYRSAGNEVGIAAGGAQVATIGTATAYFAVAMKTGGAVDASAGFTVAGANIMPPGLIFPWLFETAPTGFAMCYGQACTNAVSSVVRAQLVAAGNPYGTDGTDPLLPDLRGRVVAGWDSMGGTSANRLTDQTGGLNGDTLGDTGGAETHTLTEAQMPAHDHGGVTGSTTPELDRQNTAATSIGSAGSLYFQTQNTANSNTQASTEAHTHTIASAGGGGAHNNVQPTIILNYIIKT